MKITDLQINHLVEPVGFLMLETPVLGFKIVDATGNFQTSTEITVTQGDAVCYHCKTNERLPVYPLDFSLQPRTRYDVRATVMSDANELAMATTFFETGKMQEPWQAKWITPSDFTQDDVPTLTKDFYCEKDIKDAKLYVSCEGLYDVKINGSEADTERLTPYCNDYNSWMQVITHDVAHILQKGENLLSFTIAGGWHQGRFGLEGRNCNYGKVPKLICELHITFTDETHTIILSDGSFKSSNSVYKNAEIYDGVKMDFTRDLTTRKPVIITEGHNELLCDRLSPPVKVQETIQVARVFSTPKGEWCLDMGQNMVGWLRVNTTAFAEKNFSLHYFEVLDPDGNVYLENLRSAKQMFTYNTDGESRVVEPRFTYYGFRYVWVQGLENIDATAFTGCVVHSTMAQTGEIVTSNDDLNRLFLNALWGQKGNFVDVPTDCPQRDERLGWTGDAQVFCGTATFNMDTAAFFSKYLHDIKYEQKSRDGAVPHFVPSFHDAEDTALMHSSSAWGDVATVVPWTLYEHYGDITMLKSQYANMKAWLEYVRGQASENHLWDSGFHFGDWLALDTPRPERPLGNTPNELVASAYYLYSCELTAKAAEALHYTEDATEYKKLASKIRTAMQQEFLTSTGRVASDTQTANVLALFMHFATDVTRAAGDLQEKIRANDMHLNTGFVGTAYLCRALSDNGHSDTAWQLILNKNYPSWLYEVKMGATTIWERWNSIKPDGTLGDVSMNSYNHYAYGAVIEWLYRNAAGFKPNGSAVMRIEPQPNGRLEWLSATYDSPFGKYRSAWKITENMLVFTVEIPFNAQAEVVLPDVADSVFINGIETNYSEPILLSKGSYTIKYVPVKNYYIVYDADSPMAEVLTHPVLNRLLRAKLPDYASLPGYLFLEAPTGSVCDFMKHFGIELDAEVQKEIKEEWAHIRAWDN